MSRKMQARIKIQYKILVIFLVSITIILSIIYFRSKSIIEEHTYGRIKNRLLNEIALGRAITEKYWPDVPDNWWLIH